MNWKARLILDKLKERYRNRLVKDMIPPDEKGEDPTHGKDQEMQIIKDMNEMPEPLELGPRE